jgi:hypothetical protein
LGDVALAALIDIGRRRVDQDDGFAVGVVARDDAPDRVLFHFVSSWLRFMGGILWGGCPLVNAGRRRGCPCDSMACRRYFRLRRKTVFSR